MRTDGWNHNTHYHELLLAAVPRGCVRALDVGCGTGAFARRLSPVVRHVEALDRDETVIRRARGLSPNAPNVRFVSADFMQWQQGGGYDFVSMVAVLHHLPLHDALVKSSALLRPGGVLAVLGLDRAESFLHACARSAIAYPLSAYYRLSRSTASVEAGIMQPALRLAEIREEAHAVIPGATITPHALWRYSLLWTKL